MTRRRLALLITSTIVLVLVAGTIQLGRAGGRSAAARAMASIMPFEAAPPLPKHSPRPDFQPESAIFLAPSKIIRTAKLSLEVKDWSGFDATLRGLAAHYGYLANAEVATADDGKYRASITLRVEASRFDQALAEFKGLGTVKSEHIGAEDIARAYTDLEARRANKRVAAARMRDIIANRTGRLEEIIQAEQALSAVTEEIERLDALKRGYDGQLTYSTIQAEVFEPLAKPEGPSLWKPFKDALVDTRTTLIAMAAFLLEALLVLAPWALLGGFGWRIWRKRKDRGLTISEAAP
jgi:hypothetical protein